MIKLKLNLYPTECNLCGGTVEYISNELIYGKIYGSGKCYHCKKCGAYVGTHQPRPKEALGILANPQMRQLKIKCHYYFDKLWGAEIQEGYKNKNYYRKKYYRFLAKKLNISEKDCHFGYFDLKLLEKAHIILKNKVLKMTI